MDKCKICGNEKNNKYFKYKEFLFGFFKTEIFDYFQCNKCKCLQICDVPDDLSKYYPDNYYSFASDKSTSKFADFIYYLIRLGNVYKVSRKGFIGRIVYLLLPEFIVPIESGEDIRNKKILDVGCGNGRLLKSLNVAGVKNLYGVDLFIEDNLIYNYPNSSKIHITKGEIFDLEDKFDIILFNHSLEHMLLQEETLKKARELLNDDGKLIIAIPIKLRDASKEYNEYGAGVDAPRHLFIHSYRSMAFISKNAGFIIKKVVHNGTWQYAKTKLLEKNIPFAKQDKFWFSPIGCFFMFGYSIIAKWKNYRKRSNSVAFYLEPNK